MHPMRAPFLAFRRGVPSEDEVPIVRSILETYAENLRTLGGPVPATVSVHPLWDDCLYRGLSFLKALDTRKSRETEAAVIERVVGVPDRTVGPGWRAHLVGSCQEILKARAGP